VALLPAAPARADNSCPVIAGGAATLATIDASARLAFIQRGIRRDAHNVRIWAWTWAALYSGTTVANALRIPFSDSEGRKDASVATGGALLGVAALAFMPLKVMADQGELDRLLESPPGGRDACALVADAERLLVRDAASEEFGRSPLVHAGNFILNLGIGLLLSLAFGHGIAGAISMVIGFVVGEIQIATQPTGSVRVLEDYRAGEFGRSIQETAAGPLSFAF
jgi:hypothetical protein